MADPEAIEHGRRVAEWFVAFVAVGYYSPTITAALRGKPWFGLFLWNTFFGWTGFGWAAAWWRATE